MNLETSSEVLLSDVAKTLNLHPTNPVTPIEGHPSKVPTGHFFESESASDGVAGGSGGHGGFPPMLPPGDKLSSRDP